MFQWIKIHESSDWTVAEDQLDGFLTFDRSLIVVPHIVGPAIYPPAYGDSAPIHKAFAHEATVVIDTEAKVAHHVTFFDTSINGEAYVPQLICEVKSRKPNDCGVVAIAMILGINYSAAQVIAMHHGWASTKGINPGFIEVAVTHKGLQTKPVDQVVGLTVSSAKSKLGPGRTYILYTKTHGIAVVDSVIYNAMGCEYDTVVSAFEVVK
jgi:hypothetical protein